jgi:cytochrome c oxidase cbb3-type subunit 2
MPGYPALARTGLGYADMAAHLTTLRALGVPYDDAMVANAVADIEAQASADADAAGLLERYPGAAAGDFDGDPARVTELDALIAYLQVLGRMVDFTTYRPEYAAPGGG